MPDMSIPVGGQSVPAYLAIPSGIGLAGVEPAGPDADGTGPARWPGLVVIHEINGLTADMKAKADDLAGHGYLALAPDLFEGRFWGRCVLGIFRQLRAGSGPAFTVLDSARQYLAGREECTGKVGVIGFCMGGGFAVLCAPRPGFAAASVNYGEVPKDAEDVLAGACPVVGSYGGRDPMGTVHPERLERALVVNEIPHDVKIYPGVGHRFLTKSSGAGAVFAKVARMNYSEHDAADAWQRIYGFFGEYLGR